MLRFSVLALLLCLAIIAGSNATSSRSAEEYWRSIWPDTSMPKNLEYLLGSGMKDEENKETQYPYTSFFEDDLHADKQMTIIFNNPYANEKRVMEKDSMKSSHPQPRGVGSWKRNKMNDEDTEKSSYVQPWGVGSWKRDTMEKELEESSPQPWGVRIWRQNMMNADLEKSSSTQPWGVRIWRQNTMNADLDPEKSNLDAICNAKERVVGEDDMFRAKSVESLLDFVTSKLGKDIEALTSSFVPHQSQYKVLEGVQRVSNEGVMCHKLNFGNPVFYCHQVNATITYIVPMEAADGTRTRVVAICHHDTRGMDPHMLLHQLKVMPGTVPVCHFLGSGAISWVPKNNGLKAAY